jgi:hypothetical protein
MRPTQWTAAASLLLLLLVGCERDPAVRTAMMPEQTVVVFADGVDWAAVEKPLREIFEEEVETPQSESLYNVRRERATEFDFFSQFGMILIVGTHDRVGEALSLLGTELRDQVLAAARSDESRWLVIDHDLWAHPQIVGVLTAPNRVQLESRIRVRGPALRATYDSFVRGVVGQKILHRRQTAEEERIAAETGLDLAIPARWEIRDYSPEVPRVAIWKRTAEEDRQLLVQAFPGASSKGLSERCRVWRNQVVSEVYDGDWVRAEGLQVSEGVFHGQPGVRLRGLWENQGYVMGGPFETWCIPEPEAGRTLLIDMAVYAPGESKVEGLRELETLADRVRCSAR